MAGEKNKRIVPAFLLPGDTILIIGTARARNSEAIKPAIKILSDWGLKVVTGSNLFKVHHQFAGTDEERAHDLQWALDHHEAKAILIAGGGYGTLRIIDKVNFTNFLATPKWIVGYSDTTVLHFRLLTMGVAGLHGTMAFQFEKNLEATNSIRELLFGKQVNYVIPHNKNNRSGKTSAVVVGGNLSLMYAISGSIDELDTKGKILFIEDLDEQYYHLDRMMLQLKRSGKLSHLGGLVVGGISDMNDNAIPFGRSSEEIIMDAVSDYNYPVCFDFPAGHIEKNMALYLGKQAELIVEDNFTSLKYL